jgi:hypothetical protein
MNKLVKMLKAEEKNNNQLAEWLKWPKTENSDKISKNTQKVKIHKKQSFCLEELKIFTIVL